jgi:pimeloyl-ACP methyl ester carboxylesterase
MSGVIFSSLFEFHNDLVPGYDFARDLAALGHTSVVIDRVGYGKTRPYPADGRSVCMGAQADMLHQVVDELRTGRYTVVGSSGPHPRAFARVAIAGYSLGGLVDEIEAASFRDASSLVTIGWAEQGFTSYAAATPYVLAHCKPGLAKPPSGRVGYFRTVAASKVPLLVSPQADPRVRPLFAKNEELDACGQFLSAGQWFGGLAKPALRRVGIPVLVVYGDYDVLYGPAAWPAQLAHFTGTRDRTLVGIPDGQMLMLDHHASLTRHVIADWLQAHSF